MRRWPLAVILVAIGCAGCSPPLPGIGRPTATPGPARASPAPSPAAPVTLRLTEAEDLQTLDPIFMTDDFSVQVGFEIYQGLTALNPSNQVVPALAARWEIADEGRRYTFHLRTEGRFASGRAITAEVVRWSWERALDPALASPLRFLMRPLGVTGAPARLNGVTAPDAETLEVRLPEAANEFLTLLALPPFWVVDRPLVEADAAWAEKATAAGSGLYRITTWERGRRLVFEAQGTTSARAASVSIEIVHDARERLQRLRQRGSDLAHGIPPLSLLEASAHPEAFSVAFAPGLRTVWLGFNVERFPGSDARFRQALAHAIDRSRLADLALVGQALGVPSTRQVPPAVPGHASDAVYPLDRERAQALWKEAGSPAVAIWFSDGELNRRVAQELAAQFARVLGAHVELHAEGFGDFIHRRSAGEFPVFLGGWTGDYPHWRAFLEPLDLAGAQFNDFHLHDAEVDRLVAQGNHAVPPSDPVSYRDAERRVLTLAALVPLYSTREGFVVQPALSWPLRPEPWPARWEEARLAAGARASPPAP